MEGERRKRKLENEEEEEESEEQQMEKFFALIKSTKEARDRVYKEKKKEEKSKGAVWKPTFQPQDFIDDDGELERIHHTSHAPAAPPSDHREVAEKELPEEATAVAGAAASPDGNGNKEKAKGDDLDLRLSL